jgi:hypothetical protein
MCADRNIVDAWRQVGTSDSAAGSGSKAKDGGVGDIANPHGYQQHIERRMHWRGDGSARARLPDQRSARMRSRWFSIAPNSGAMSAYISAPW